MFQAVGVDLEHVPTVLELYAKGLATVSGWSTGKTRKPTHFTLKPEGQRLIYEAMATNAERLRSHDRQARVRRKIAQLAAEADGGRGRMAGGGATSAY